MWQVSQSEEHQYGGTFQDLEGEERMNKQHTRACPKCGKIVPWTFGPLNNKLVKIGGSIITYRNAKLICPVHGEFKNPAELKALERLKWTESANTSTPVTASSSSSLLDWSTSYTTALPFREDRIMTLSERFERFKCRIGLHLWVTWSIIPYYYCIAAECNERKGKK